MARRKKTARSWLISIQHHHFNLQFSTNSPSSIKIGEPGQRLSQQKCAQVRILIAPRRGGACACCDGTESPKLQGIRSHFVKDPSHMKQHTYEPVTHFMELVVYMGRVTESE